jgi:chromosome partitioning protein
MQVISLCSTKGGSSKSTLCTNLATCAARPIIVDLDINQGTCEGWWRSRPDGKDYPRLINSNVTGRQTKFTTFINAGVNWADFMFIDTPGAVSREVQEAISLSDICLIPCRASLPDMRAIKSTVELVRGRRAAVVLTQAPVGRGSSEAAVVKEARDALKVYGLTIAPTVIRYRIAYQHAFSSGLTVLEYEPSGAAANEVRALFQWVRGELDAAQAA